MTEFERIPILFEIIKRIKSKKQSKQLEKWAKKNGLIIAKEPTYRSIKKSLASAERNNPFQRMHLNTLKVIENWFKREGIIVSDYDLVDLGSGDGLLCLNILSQMEFRNVTGVEIEAELHRIAELNRQIFENLYPKKSGRVLFINSDIVTYSPKKIDTIFICFNSFAPQLLSEWTSSNLHFLTNSLLIWVNDKNIDEPPKLWKFRGKITKTISVFELILLK